MHDDKPGFERSDVSRKLVVWFAIGLSIVMGIIFLAIAGFERLLANGKPERRLTLPARWVAGPQLQAQPSVDYTQWSREAKADLKRTAWVDREHRVIRIPIDRAMQLLSERGLPPTTKSLTPIEMRQQKAQMTP